jgi:hypothetical protein
MLTHIVLFKYKAEITDAVRGEHLATLKGLAKAGIPGVVDLKAGADVVRSPRSYDTGLIARFTDRSALDAYQKHPLHVPVAQHGASLSEHIVAVDFEE